jgi:hypothetical protein
MANSMGSASFRFFEVRGVKASAAEGKSRGSVKVDDVINTKSSCMEIRVGTYRQQ